MDGDEIERLLLMSDRQCGLSGFRASDLAFGPHAMNGSVAASVEEADALDATMPPAALAMVGSARDRMRSVDSARYADVTFRNGWKVSALTCDYVPGVGYAVMGDAGVPTYEVAVRGCHLDDLNEPRAFVDEAGLDAILAEAQAAPYPGLGASARLQ